MDVTVEACVVHANRVRLMYHPPLHQWLPWGGHLALGDDPAQALCREITAARGLEVDIWSQKPAPQFEGKKFLYPPVYLDGHPMTPTHHHSGLVYVATAASDQVTLAADAPEAIRWFSAAELHDPTCGMQPDVLC